MSDPHNGYDHDDPAADHGDIHQDTDDIGERWYVLDALNKAAGEGSDDADTGRD